MSDEPEPTMLTPRVQAEKLAAALTRKGFIAMRLTTADHELHPCVQLTWSPTIGKTEHSYIYVAPDDKGCGAWWFWWDSLDPIAPAEYVPVAVEAILTAISLRRMKNVRAV